MKSVLENDKEYVEDGKLLNDAINQGIGNFVPDMMYEQIVKNYKLAEKIYGKSIIIKLSGYDPDYIERNLNVPEFRKELKERMNNSVKELKKKNLIDGQGISERGIQLASLVMFAKELDHLIPKGFYGEKAHKKSYSHGDRTEIRDFRKHDKFRDIDIRKSIRKAIKRGKSIIDSSDLMISEREKKGTVHVVYSIDSSGSMKGEKIATAKKAGISLAYKAIENKDKVGLIVFGPEVDKAIEPTSDFPKLLREIVSIKASSQTEFAEMIKKSVALFPSKATKHLIILTDALPTVGDDPEKKTLAACSLAKSCGITISIAGISLDKEGRKLAEKMAQIGEGRMYNVRNLEEINKIILEDYYSFS